MNVKILELNNLFFYIIYYNIPDPSLGDVNSEYDVWVKNYEITSGDNSFCNNISKYEGDSPKHLDVKIW